MPSPSGGKCFLALYCRSVSELLLLWRPSIHSNLWRNLYLNRRHAAMKCSHNGVFTRNASCDLHSWLIFLRNSTSTRHFRFLSFLRSVGRQSSALLWTCRSPWVHSKAMSLFVPVPHFHTLTYILWVNKPYLQHTCYEKLGLVCFCRISTLTGSWWRVNVHRQVHVNVNVQPVYKHLLATWSSVLDRLVDRLVKT